MKINFTFVRMDKNPLSLVTANLILLDVGDFRCTRIYSTDA